MCRRVRLAMARRFLRRTGRQREPRQRRSRTRQPFRSSPDGPHSPDATAARRGGLKGGVNEADPLAIQRPDERSHPLWQVRPHQTARARHPAAFQGACATFQPTSPRFKKRLPPLPGSPYRAAQQTVWQGVTRASQSVLTCGTRGASTGARPQRIVGGLSTSLTESRQRRVGCTGNRSL